MSKFESGPFQPHLPVFAGRSGLRGRRRFLVRRCAGLAGLAAGFAAVTLLAAPVTPRMAARAGAAEVQRFFPGGWQPAGEMILQDLAGDTAAYVLIYGDSGKAAGDAGAGSAPAAFLQAQRARLADQGKPATGNAAELYGEDRFATIFISASDTEPVVLRCFKGLPPQMVKEPEALALGAKAGGGKDLRVRHCLLLGLFDEAFLVEPTAGGAAWVVDLRTGAAVSEQAAKARAQRKQAVADPERAGRCQAAWAKYRATEAAGRPPGVPAGAKSGAGKQVLPPAPDRK
jgi:hypothetical protein